MADGKMNQIGTFRDEQPSLRDQAMQAFLDELPTGARAAALPFTLPFEMASRLPIVSDLIGAVPDVAEMGVSKFLQTRPGRAYSALVGEDPEAIARQSKRDYKRAQENLQGVIPANVEAAWAELNPPAAPIDEPQNAPEPVGTVLEEAPPTRLFARNVGAPGEYAQWEFGNQPPRGMSNEEAAASYEAGLGLWKGRAMEEDRMRPPSNRIGTSGMKGSFNVQAGRGGFSPSAPIPAPGTATAEDWNMMSPLQRDIYNERMQEWTANQMMEAQTNPLAVYQRAADIIAQQPDVQAEIELAKKGLGKKLEEGVIDEENYDAYLAAMTRNIIDKAMMQQGASRAALDPEAHYRAGVTGVY